MYESQFNMAGLLVGIGCKTETELVEHRGDSFAGGFATSGTYDWKMLEDPADSSLDLTFARSRTVAIALPDDATFVVFQRAWTLISCYVNGIYGLNLHLPNDIFNGGSRRCQLDGREVILRSLQAESGNLSGRKLSIDDCMSVNLLSPGNLKVLTPASRTINLYKRHAMTFAGKGGSLYSNPIVVNPCQEQRRFVANEELMDLAVVVRVGKAAKAPVQAEMISANCMKITGANGKHYSIAANPSELSIDLSDVAQNLSVISGKTTSLEPGDWSLGLYNQD